MVPQVSYLADWPEFIPTIAATTQEQYAELWPDRTIEWRVARLRAHMNRQTLPIAWVIHDGRTLLGTAALRTSDFDGMHHLTPWLSGVFVLPSYRRQGLGRVLCAAVEQEAAARGLSRLYLGTFDQQKWFGVMGWEVLQKGYLQNRPCDIMFKDLQSSPDRLG